VLDATIVNVRCRTSRPHSDTSAAAWSELTWRWCLYVNLIFAGLAAM